MSKARVTLRTGADALAGLWCSVCAAALGPFPVRPVLDDVEGDRLGLICQDCLTVPLDELAERLEDAAEDFRGRAAALAAVAAVARRRALLRPTLGEWLAASQRAERELFRPDVT